ncbi:MAG: Flp pilus assembly complex ATPase component TadA [Candidatus Lokiarchaeota archaeon]|nr:Flp pilus assembly complex ATPase component TadA [Candidatus Lokiarchaeota archaeon]
MINNYFGFTKNPFLKHVNTKDIFNWGEFENISNRLSYFLKDKGIFLLTGLIGSGKTTAIKTFSESINPNSHRIVYIHDSFDSKRDFYRTLLEKLDVNPPFIGGDARNMLRKHLLEMYYIKKISPIIVFDEAQNLNGYILEEIRLLSNFDFESIFPALFILSGHNLLKQRLALNENEALNQRITLRFHLTGMTLEETCSYMKHCLEKAGSSHAIFTDSVLNKIHESSNGVIRKINTICSNLLLSAMTKNKKIVDDLVFDTSRGEWE